MPSTPASCRRETGTHIPLADGAWTLWRPFLLRAAGFPAAGVARLATPELAHDADQAMLSCRSPDAYRMAFEGGMARLSSELQAIARQPEFQLAMTWQNPGAVKTGLASFLRKGSSGATRNRRCRAYEVMLASYWQRYNTKNDTIGFFGPMVWGRLDPGLPHGTAEPGQRLISRYEVFFESWAIDKLADTFARDAEVRRWLAPCVPPYVRIAGLAARLPGPRTVPLSPEEALVLGCCDGVTAACRIAEKVTGSSSLLAGEQEVYGLLDALTRRRLVSWRLNVPVAVRPERELRRVLSRIGDARVAARGHAMLDRMEAARDAVSSGAREPAALAKALDDLGSAFQELTGTGPSRNHGQAYGGRTLVYHDARRDFSLTMGRDFVRALRPLVLLLQSVRWLTWQVGQALTSLLRDLAREYSASHREEPPLDWLWLNVMPLLLGGKDSVADQACAELRRRWMTVLACPLDAPSVHYSYDDLRGAVAAAFPASRPGWTAARYCSPDILICARGPASMRRGDFSLVLGELHIAINSLRNAAAVDQHPQPQDLLDCLSADEPGPRLLPVLPKENSGRLTTRTQPALVRKRDFLVALSDETADPARERLLRASDLTVTESGGQLWVTEPGGRRFNVLDVFSEMLMNLMVNAFGIFHDQPHTPRVRIDELVISRESWLFPADSLSFAMQKDEAVRFAEARKWMRDNSLPSRLFVKLGADDKPFYLDFDSPLYINMFCRAVRAGLAGKNPGGQRVRLTEVLPALEDLWVTDSRGRGYTSELRLAIVDRPA